MQYFRAQVLGNAQNVTNATCRSARAEKIRNRRNRAASARTAAVQCSAYLQLDLQKTMHLCFQENQRIQRLGLCYCWQRRIKRKVLGLAASFWSRIRALTLVLPFGLGCSAHERGVERARPVAAISRAACFGWPVQCRGVVAGRRVAMRGACLYCGCRVPERLNGQKVA